MIDNARDPHMKCGVTEPGEREFSYGVGLAILFTAAMLIGFFAGMSVATWVIVG
jgi:hypothetical protein